MRKRLKEMEDEAAALREMQAKVEKEMGAVQGFPLSLASLCTFRAHFRWLDFWGNCVDVIYLGDFWTLV